MLNNNICMEIINCQFLNKGRCLILLILNLCFCTQITSQNNLEDSVINDILPEIHNYIEIKRCDFSYDITSYIKTKVALDSNAKINPNIFRPSSCDTCIYVLRIWDTLLQLNIDPHYYKKYRNTNSIPSYYPVDSFLTQNKMNAKVNIDTFKMNSQFVAFTFSNYDNRFLGKYDFEKYGDMNAGCLIFSRMYFDIERKYGLVFCANLCSGMNGVTYMILLNQHNNKWFINKAVLWGVL